MGGMNQPMGMGMNQPMGCQMGYGSGYGGSYAPPRNKFSGAWRGIPGCHKCGGSGYKCSKKKSYKQKPCKECMKRQGFCPKCNGTGFKIGKKGKTCKCQKIFGNFFKDLF